MITEIWLLDFKQIPTFEKATSVKTPAGLENLISKEYKINEGDFIFLEWPKLQEEILLTNERTAIIRSDTSEFFFVSVDTFLGFIFYFLFFYFVHLSRF